MNFSILRFKISFSVITSRFRVAPYNNIDTQKGNSVWIGTMTDDTETVFPVAKTKTKNRLNKIARDTAPGDFGLYNGIGEMGSYYYG
ncbi:MAG: hypothetical protein HKN25_04875 [Pyrinomonadaceae bacterium]|nr:hypothetical protein [Pyrinomonadaceae bacterium]